MVTVPLVPALCHQTARLTPPTDPGWAYDAKHDGWSCLVERTISGIRFLNGRNGSDYSGQLPYLEESLMALPVGTILHGELVTSRESASGHGSSAVGSVMTRTIKHIPTEHSPPLTFVVFDVLAVADADGEVVDVRREPWSTRRKLIEVLATLPHVEVSRLFTGPDPLGQALAAGLEGVVCKRVDSPYVPGRSSYWVKVKPQQTAEAVVIGFKPGKTGGRWDGKVGAFELEMLDADGERNGVLTTAKCGTDAIHISATRERDALVAGERVDERDRWLGQPVEVLHNGLSRSGVPRHPQVAGRRQDLPTPKPSKPAPPPPAPPRSVAGKASRRNYRAMKAPGKLAQAIAELRAGEGDAYDRCIMQGADPAKDLEKALEAARINGINVEGATA